MSLRWTRSDAAAPVAAGEGPVVIFRIGSLGDTVVALPCFHRIARSFANARRILITDIPGSLKATAADSLLGRSGLVHDVICFPPPPRRPTDFWRLLREIRGTRSRQLIYVADRGVAGTLRDLAFFYFCGIRKVIGAPLRSDLRRLRIDPVTGYTEREAERLARCLAPLGRIDLSDPQMWDLRLQPDEIAAADAALAPFNGKNFIALSIGGRASAKDWGDDNWRQLFRAMAREWPDLAFVFIGAADERDRSAALGEIWSGPSLNLCGRLAPRESAAAMRRALAYLGHDNGPMHLAAAVDVPCVAMFGNFNMPRWWHPFGKHHQIVHKMDGIRAISVEEIMAALRLVITARLRDR